jgi:hypothetical protein
VLIAQPKSKQEIDMTQQRETERKEKREPVKSTRQGGTEMFEESYRELLSGLKANWDSAQKRQREVSYEHNQKIQGIMEEAQRLLLEAQRTYADALRQCQTEPQEGLKKSQEALETYNRMVWEAQVTTEKNIENATGTLSITMQEVEKELKASYTKAWQDYLSTIKTAWGSIDVTTSSAETIQAAGQSLLAALSQVGAAARPL